MSDCMIIRRGGASGEGFDPNGAVLKVVTSTGCTVLVTGTGYSKTHQQADGFPRSGNANVTEHFFSIPASAFGTITVKATNTYGDNTKTLTVNTAGKVYEQLCGGINIILDGTFGLQDGMQIYSGNAAYDDRNKQIVISNGIGSGWLFGSSVSGGTVIPITEYTEITCTAVSRNDNGYLILLDQADATLATMSFTRTSREQTAEITNKYYDSAGIFFSSMDSITEIILA